jgi:hypothetical protein
MNAGETARLEGFKALLATDGVCLSRLAPAGGKFTALLQINPMVEIPSALVEDPREKALAEALRCPSLPAIVKSERLKDPQGNLWGVWSREDNPADFGVKFWLVKIVPGVDS